MSVQQKKLECSWDADVIEFWNASLKSYKTCHETNEQCTDSEKVTADLIKSLPPKVVSELANNNKRKIDQVDQKEGELKKAEEQEILYREQRAAEHDEEARYNGMKEELYRQSEDAYVKGDQYNRSQEEQYNALEEEQYNEVEEEQYNEVEEQYNEVEEQYNDLENDQEPSSKKAKYTEEPQYQQSYQQPPMPPMPPMPTNDDGLSNMIMAWYYAGYYTGLYQAGRQ